MGFHFLHNTLTFSPLFWNCENDMYAINVYNNNFQNTIIIFFKGQILIKDFNNFTDRGLYSGSYTNPLNNNIFFSRGERWRTMRQKLSPTFTANKLKYMNDQVKECSDNLLATINKTVIEESTSQIEIREMMAKYSTDVIGTCAFGLKLDAINDPDSEFRKHGKTVFQPSLRSKIRMMLIFMQPSLLNFFRIRHYSQNTIAFFQNSFQQTIEYRKKHNIDRKDFVQHLMKAREDLVINPNLTSEGKLRKIFKSQLIHYTNNSQPGGRNTKIM